MQPCNYIPFETATLDSNNPLLDELFDLDLLLTEEGVFINLPERE